MGIGSGGDVDARFIASHISLLLLVSLANHPASSPGSGRHAAAAATLFCSSVDVGKCDLDNIHMRSLKTSLILSRSICFFLLRVVALLIFSNLFLQMFLFFFFVIRAAVGPFYLIPVIRSRSAWYSNNKLAPWKK